MDFELCPQACSFTSHAQRAYSLAVAGVVFLISLLSTVNYLLRRRQGDWDAWMMYNRVVRFAYLDQAHWLQSFSPRMDPLFHADDPLLLAMNIGAGWQARAGTRRAYRWFRASLFAIGCVGLIASSVGSVKSGGQAALALIVLWGLPVFVNEGARQWPMYQWPSMSWQREA